MELKKIKSALNAAVMKYKYVILVLMIGLALMLIPGQTKEKTLDTQEEPIQRSLQEDLQKVLTQVKGAGEVQVILNEKTGPYTLYQTNEDISVSDGNTDTKLDTVVITDDARSESGLIRQVNPPTYLGALILCQGADDPAVKLAITDAVSKLTGLGADRIAVLKMK